MFNNIFIKTTGITLLVILISVNTAFTQVDLSGKHIQRTAPNLLDDENSKAIRPNKNIKTKRWQHIQKGRVAAKKTDIDDHVLWTNEHSYDKGTGSFKLVNTGSKYGSQYFACSCNDVDDIHQTQRKVFQQLY